MYIVFFGLFIVYIIVTTVISVILKMKPKDVVITENTWVKNFIKNMAFLWGVTIAVLILCFIGDISLKDLGFRLISFKYNIWFTVVALVLSGLTLVLFMHNLICSLTSAKWREKQVIDEGTREVLPRTKKEKWLFSFSALSAGICEEIIYRGFIVFLLQAIFPSMPIFLIILLPSVVFGLGHFYQGLQGVIQTGLLGALFMSLFLATDSLLLAILLHFIIDFSATFIISEERV
jgi:membrane protease YdiL (CAAX protease family)